MTLLEFILSEIPKNYSVNGCSGISPQPFLLPQPPPVVRPTSRGSHICCSKIPPQAGIFMKNKKKKWCA